MRNSCLHRLFSLVAEIDGFIVYGRYRFRPETYSTYKHTVYFLQQLPNKQDARIWPPKLSLVCLYDPYSFHFFSEITHRKSHVLLREASLTEVSHAVRSGLFGVGPNSWH